MSLQEQINTNKENLNNTFDFIKEFAKTFNHNVLISNNIYHHLSLIDFISFLLIITLVYLHRINTNEIDKLREKIENKFIV